MPDENLLEPLDVTALAILELLQSRLDAHECRLPSGQVVSTDKKIQAVFCARIEQDEGST
jgi:hypothetical protein